MVEDFFVLLDFLQLPIMAPTSFNGHPVYIYIYKINIFKISCDIFASSVSWKYFIFKMKYFIFK